MKYFLQILILAASFTTAKATDYYPVALIPDSLKKNATAVVREDMGIYEVKSPSEATFKVRMVVTIFKENHPYSVFPLGYNKNSKIKNVRARYYDAMGKLVRKVEKEEIKDIAGSGGGTLYTDSRVKYVENEYGVLPYTFEIEYEEQYTAIQSYPPWSFQIYGVSVQTSDFMVIMPKTMGLNHRIQNSNLKPTIENKGETRIFHWVMNDLAAVKREPFMPSRRDLLPYLELSPERFGIDKTEGSMKDWASFGKFMADLNRDRDKVSPEMAAKIKEMTADCKTNLEKIDTLYHYMQKNMRYVSVQLGIGGWQTFDAQYVEKNKYGDCKALSNFMKSMLKSAGIEGQLVVVSAGDDDFFDPDPTFCLPRFNHMILHIPSENMFLECTSNDNPTGYLGGFTQGRGVLLLTENSGKIGKTPALDATTNGQTSKATIQLAADGSATLKNASILRGTFQDNMRSILTNSSKEEFKKRFQESHKLPTFKIDALETSVERNKPEVNINYTFSFEKYGSKAGTRLFVPVNLHNAFDDTPAPTEKRIHPIEAGGTGYTETVETTLNLPEGYDVETIPTPKTELTSIYGNYSSTIEKSDKSVVFKRTMTIKPVNQPAEKFNEFRDFYKKMQQADAAKVVLKIKN
jgi:transglutaminase-like putative cysteine protease